MTKKFGRYIKPCKTNRYTTKLMLVRGGEKESVLEIIENFKSSLVSYANKAALNGSFTKLKHICLT